MTVLDQPPATPETASGAGRTAGTAPPATVVPRRPTAPGAQRRRRTGGLRRTDVLAILGALAAGAATTGVLWTQLGPFTGALGYVVVTWLVTVAWFALLVSFDENRSLVKDRVAAFVVHSLGIVLVAALVFVIYYTLKRGYPALPHLNFYIQDMRSVQATDPLTKGGVLHAVIGTLIELGIALTFAVPLGLVAAVYLHEVPGRFSRFIRTVVEAMTALPDIIAGLFIYATLILIFHLGPSGLAAGAALGVTILPIIIRAADVVLRLVPASLKEASYALGSGQWRTTWHVLLPTARSGLTNAVILGAARAIGETSPVLLTASATGYVNLDPLHGPMMSLPLLAYTLVASPEPNEITRGFGAAAVLLILVLVLFAVARWIGGRAPGDLSAGQVRRRERASLRTARRFDQYEDLPVGRAAADRSTGRTAAMTNPVRLRRPLAALLAVLLGALVSLAGPTRPAAAASYVPISGSGSTWSYNAIHAWASNIEQNGVHVNYAEVGSSTGRSNFKQGTVDWAASDIPYGVADGNSSNTDDPPTNRGYVYIPDTAGGTTFMYNLKIGTRRVTNLRLSGENIAKIFTGTLTNWADPAIARDNPGLKLPAIKIVPVVRSDGSGATAQFTQWMIATQGKYWTAYCAKVHVRACTQTSTYPILNGSAMVGQSGDLGVSGYVSQAQAVGAIGYVEYSYAIQAGFPVAKVLNVAGYYTEPTPGHVAVALLAAKINMDKSNKAVYLTQDLSQVYVNPDPRTYELSSYSYMILPTTSNFGFNANKGYTLGEFGKYFLCQGQSLVDALGYSALPINLVEAGFGQLQNVPGAQVPTATTAIIRSCNNPTFSTDGTNTLARDDPKPPECDKQGPVQCSTGTGGAKGGTPVSGGGGSGGGSGGSGGSGGPGGGGATGGGGGSGGAGGGASGGSGPNAAGTNGGNAACEPDDVNCASAGGTGSNGPDTVDAIPVDTSAALGNGFEVALMVVAAVLLLGLGLVPPLVAHGAGSRRVRRSGRGGAA
jgi:phosphate ABC transporter permease subunit PstA/phosphate ABC transporter phosphate-binding protein